MAARKGGRPAPAATVRLIAPRPGKGNVQGGMKPPGRPPTTGKGGSGTGGGGGGTGGK
jgi:hypothetical protein